MYKKYSRGWVAVITGPMFSGKTEELIKRVKVLDYAQMPMLIVKPKVDNRGEPNKIISRNGTSIPTALVSNVKDIDRLITSQHQVIVIDEAQFLRGDVVGYCHNKANNGFQVIVAGLDQDFRGKPFGPIPNLLATAEFVEKLTAVCFKCHNAATMTYRKSKKGRLVQIGNFETYEARCRMCHAAGMRNEF